MRVIPQQCFTFLADPEIENWIPHPYKDQKSLWTYGIGHLILKGELYPLKDGGSWSLGMPDPGADAFMDLPASDAERVCAQDMTIAANSVCKYTNNIDQYNDNQYAALLAFAFNIGGGAPAGSPRGPSGYAGSGMLAALNRGDLNGCFAGWAQWNKFRNPETHLLEISAGLVKRRNLEMALYNKPL